MVTIATEAICAWIVEHTPVKPRYFFVEANLSGDKKASAQSFLHVRGKKVTAEVDAAGRAGGADALHTTPARMVDYWRMSALGGVHQRHDRRAGPLRQRPGRALPRLRAGCRPAWPSRRSGVTRFEVHRARRPLRRGDPAEPHGRHGRRRHGPAQPAGVPGILGLTGAGKARALAEVCAGLCLAGELSIIGALCGGRIAAGPRQLAGAGRGQRRTRKTTDG